MKILLCDYSISGNGLEEKKFLEENLDDVVFEAYQYEDEALFLKKIEDVDVIMTCFLTISKEAISYAKKLKLISVDATGYGNVDIDACREAKITVATLGDYCSAEVADHTMALILALEKNLKQYDELANANQYSFKSLPCRQSLSRQTMAIVGYGQIGQAVAKRARGFGFRILAVTRHKNLWGSKDELVTFVPIEEALKQADVITNHMNQTPENEDYFNKDKFSKMEKTPLFINVGRGACVDEQALLEAIKKGFISGAGLDVLKDTHPSPEVLKQFELGNVLLTPHSAFYSREVMEFLRTAALGNIVHFFRDEKEKITNLVVEGLQVRC